MKWLLALFCLAVAGFCLFGFMATFEPGVPGATLFRVGYVVVGIAAIVGGAWPFFAPKTR